MTFLVIILGVYIRQNNNFRTELRKRAKKKMFVKILIYDRAL